MIDKLMTPEELEAYTQKVWASAKEDILKQVDIAIRSELLMHVGSSVRKMTFAQLRDIVQPILDRRKAELVTKAEKWAEQLDELLEQQIQDSMKITMHEFYDELKTRFFEVFFRKVTQKG